MNAITSPDLLVEQTSAPSFADRFCVTAEDMEGFAAVSGDRSPVHGAADFARGLGLEGRVVYEGLIVARLSRLVSANLPGKTSGPWTGLWGGLRIDFHHPLYVGEPATMRLALDDLLPTSGVARLSFRVEAGGRLIADGGIDMLTHAA
jgi:acyl dehydratase